MTQSLYNQPQNLMDAVSALSRPSLLHAIVVSGCTDVYPAHVGKALPHAMIDVSAIAEMRQIEIVNDEIRIGGAVTWTEIAEARLPPAFAALQCAAKQVGSIQVQNRGTIAGNICNASPAADGIPPLLVLDAEIELASASGLRRMPLSEFILGYRKTAIKPGEILSAIIVPQSVDSARTSFVKLGARKYLVISIVMVAAYILKNADGKVSDARVAIGSASEKALRLHHLESELKGLKPDIKPSALLRRDHLSELKPIDDVRATSGYRHDAAMQLIAEAVDQAWGA
jgi:CO/xanthine dehydrogenase FAD-binding subunit